MNDMHVLIRKTANGAEYWNNEEKKTVFVPTGSKPGFEVTENPESMIMEVDLAKDKDLTVEPAFEEMTIPQLKQYANDNNIELPADVKKREDIVKFLTDAQ